MRTILVTGANRGIGLSLCREFSSRGDRVVAACRTSSPALAETGARIEPEVDVTVDASVAALAARLSGSSIDVLVNNAGVLTRESLDDLDFDRMRRQIEINALGPLRVTAALLPLLSRGSKVAVITSLMGSMADNASGGMYGYRMSKAAVNAAGVSLARDLRARGIAVAILHPGYVRTDMTGHKGTVDPEVSARGLADRIEELSLETSGRFVRFDGEPLPW